eukprot:5895807-Amphidinium_carterae.1
MYSPWPPFPLDLPQDLNSPIEQGTMVGTTSHHEGIPLRLGIKTAARAGFGATSLAASECAGQIGSHSPSDISQSSGQEHPYDQVVDMLRDAVLDSLRAFGDAAPHAQWAAD